MMKKNKVVVLTGPTSSGKSAWAKELIEKFPLGAISADSRQVYKELTIGSAKDYSFPQELLDVSSVVGVFTAADYQHLAREAMAKALQAHRTPLLVGGSVFYIKSVLFDYHFLPTDEDLRHQLEAMDLLELVTELTKIDPELAEKIDLKNKRRVVRALESIKLSGQHPKNWQPDLLYDVLFLATNIERNTLYHKIDQSIEDQFNNGLIEEVSNLKKLKISNDRIDGLGLEYRFINQFLENKLSLKETKEQLKFAVHSFARRQLTFIRSLPEVHWVSDLTVAEQLIQRFLQ